MLQLIDAIALWWLNWRYDHKIKSFSAEHPEYGLELKKAVIAEDGMYVCGTSPAIAYLAAEAAKMLDRANASNYTQFDLVPHIASELRAVRVTVQWANGMSPAMRADKLADAGAGLITSLADIYKLCYAANSGNGHWENTAVKVAAIANEAQMTYGKNAPVRSQEKGG